MLHLVILTSAQQVPLLGDRGDKCDGGNATEFVSNQEHARVPRMHREREHAMSEIGDYSGLTIQCSKIVQELERPAQRIWIRHFDPTEALKICHASRFQVEQDFSQIETFDFG